VLNKTANLQGYFNIAAANRNNTSPGTRIGTALYDDRTKAIVTARVSNGELSIQREKDPQSDPLHMFGVLVPQELRLAQLQFSEAVGDCIDLVNVISTLGRLEQKMGSGSHHRTSKNPTSVLANR
jgi:hypothetical protein